MLERVAYCDALTLSPNRMLLADLLMQRLLKAIAEPICVPGVNAAVAVSIGVALNSQDAVELRQADMAMYAAKAAGKNRYQLSTVGRADGC
jgi:GGDEF domain-containing protein